MSKWDYDGSWYKYPIEPGELYIEKNTSSLIMVHDLFNSVPEFILSGKIDMVYVDPPWNISNLNAFYTKNKSQNKNKFDEFIDRIFLYVNTVAPKICYIEMGFQNVKFVKDKLMRTYPIVQEWEITYYKKNKMYLLRGGNDKVNFDFTGYDDSITPKLAIENENGIESVCDLCSGRGLTGITAYKLGKKFYGIELNKKRFAVMINKINQLGGKYEKVSLPFGT